jgi:small subunit ribosomal protein S6
MDRLYDLMLLVDPTAPEERRSAVLSEVEQMLSAGTIEGSYDWGTRRLAFEIDHRPEAEYRLWQFEGDAALLERLNQRLRIMDGVLRFRIIKQKPGTPPPPAPRDLSPRPREEREREPEGRVAARAAADAPAPDAPAPDAPAPDAPPPDAPAADAPAPDAPPPDAEPASEPAPAPEAEA